MALPNTERLEQIAASVDEQGFLSVGELSQLLGVSEMTIRRDLAFLDEQKRIQRTYGGAASLRASSPAPAASADVLNSLHTEGLIPDRVDVLVATSVNPRYDRLLLERVAKRDIPIIAESLSLQHEETVVAVDNYQAGYDLGRWAGEYALRQWGGQARALDLTYYLSNTQARSRGFLDGLRSAVPQAELLSLNGQSRYDMAYQLTRDALTVHTDINIIFAINDTMARGALDACKDLGLDPQDITVLPFGLEGDTLKNAMLESGYLQAGLAMFPEIVGPACIEAAIAAYNRRPLQPQLLTPYQILTRDTLPEFYTPGPAGWALRWDAVRQRLHVPIPIDVSAHRPRSSLPGCIGLIVPFIEHEWYRNLIAFMQSYASQFGIAIEIVDAEQSLKDEVDLRRREIARVAAAQVNPGDVILIDGGPIANFLAEELRGKANLTVITTAIPVFDILRGSPANTLILTGGAYRSSSQVLVGPTAEGALRELRADKLFLMVTGITQNFGLSHTNISEVTIKQAMIRSARHVILLADHTFFGQESTVQVAPLSVVSKLVTDDALPASTRLDLTRLGIQIILANM